MLGGANVSVSRGRKRARRNSSAMRTAADRCSLGARELRLFLHVRDALREGRLLGSGAPVPGAASAAESAFESESGMNLSWHVVRRAAAARAAASTIRQMFPSTGGVAPLLMKPSARVGVFEPA